MVPKVINYQCFCKTVGKYVGAIHLSNFEFTVVNKLSKIVVLNINMLGASLALGVFGQNVARFVLSM